MTSPTWAAVRIWGRADLRRRGARRTASAVPRYERASAVPDAAVLANSPSFDAHQRAETDALPEVRKSYPFEIAFGLNPIKPANFESSTLIPTTPDSVKALFGVLVAGRLPDPARADEVVVDENARRADSLPLGSTMAVGQSIPPAEVAQLPPGFVPPHVDRSYTVALKVVGIAKSVSADPGWAPSSGFFAQYGPRTAGFINAFVTLRGATPISHASPRT